MEKSETDTSKSQGVLHQQLRIIPLNMDGCMDLNTSKSMKYNDPIYGQSWQLLRGFRIWLEFLERGAGTVCVIQLVWAAKSQQSIRDILGARVFTNPFWEVEQGFRFRGPKTRWPK